MRESDTGKNSHFGDTPAHKEEGNPAGPVVQVTFRIRRTESGEQGLGLSKIGVTGELAVHSTGAVAMELVSLSAAISWS